GLRFVYLDAQTTAHHLIVSRAIFPEGEIAARGCYFFRTEVAGKAVALCGAAEVDSEDERVGVLVDQRRARGDALLGGDGGIRSRAGPSDKAEAEGGKQQYADETI